MQSVTILPGRDKTGKPEPFQGITLERGELCTIVGNTGSGKSRFIKDVEQLAHGDSVTRRRVLLDGAKNVCEEMNCFVSVNSAFFTRPLRLSCSAPFLKKISVGAAVTSYFSASGRSKLMLTFTTFSASP